MAQIASPDLTVVVPLYNEAAGLEHFHASLSAVIKDYSYELIYVNDGSQDESMAKLRKIAEADKAVRVITLSRNFGKEIATTAGIQAARGQVIITLDADGQHPVELIPKFIEKWEAGAQVVIGVRTRNHKEGFVKRLGSKLFYRVFNKFAGAHLMHGTSDFRLIDREVQRAFVTMPERNRMTRGLIDWLGFDRQYLEFEAKAREHGAATYSFKKLSKLFIDSLISHSTSPLYGAAYVGAAIIPLAVLLFIFMGVEMASGDPLGLDITGGAYISVLVLMLIGILLLSQGIIGLYLSHIHAETQGRPLYVINETESIRSNG